MVDLPLTYFFLLNSVRYQISSIIFCLQLVCFCLFVYLFCIKKQTRFINLRLSLSYVKLLSYFANKITSIFNISLLCRDTKIHKTCPCYKYNYHCPYIFKQATNILINDHFNHRLRFLIWFHSLNHQ